MEIYSIGFTQKTAEQFFSILKRSGIRRLLDVRLNNLSQLAGFAKRQDLPFFVKEICQAEYRHERLLETPAHRSVVHRVAEETADGQPSIAGSRHSRKSKDSVYR
jgi:uncharacterized protein (DUF488 family)